MEGETGRERGRGADLREGLAQPTPTSPGPALQTGAGGRPQFQKQPRHHLDAWLKMGDHSPRVAGAAGRMAVPDCRPR